MLMPALSAGLGRAPRGRRDGDVNVAFTDGTLPQTRRGGRALVACVTAAAGGGTFCFFLSTGPWPGPSEQQGNRGVASPAVQRAAGGFTK